MKKRLSLAVGIFLICTLVVVVLVKTMYNRQPDLKADIAKEENVAVIKNTENKEPTLLDKFPGKVPDNTAVVKDKVIEVNFDYKDLSYLRIGHTPGTWQSTGLYAAADNEFTVEVPEGTENLTLQIGAHTDILDKVMSKDLKRESISAIKRTLKPGINKIKTKYNGLIYLIPTKPKAGTKINVKISGAVNAPYFVLGKTTEEEWRKTIRNYPAPWAELESKGVILTIPSEGIRNLDNPKALMEKWDEIVNSYNKLVGIAPDRPEPHRSPDRPFRYVADVQISLGYMHSGYPIMYFIGKESKKIVDINQIQKEAWGFWHELGHNYQQLAWRWSQIVEVTCNIHSIHIREMYGNPSRLDEIQNDGKSDYEKAMEFINNSNPNKNYNDDSQISVMSRLVMFIQLQRAYGWDFYTKLETAYRELPADELLKITPTDQDKIDNFIIMACKISGEDLLEFFDHWALKYSENVREKVGAMKLPKPKEKLWLLKTQN